MTVDEQAFVELTAPHRRALHRHCYRLLGSLHDADDALQETMLRAWRGIDRYEPRAPVSAWLYRIATNVCLRMLERRQQNPAAFDAHLEPYPDRLLEDLPAPDPGPEAALESRESVGLAFVAALQLLPPKQRTVLVLRDVLGSSARETADLLDDTVPAVNSALQRARERLREADDPLPRPHAPAGPDAEASLMRRWVEAWEAVDLDGMVALLTTDAVMTMPPDPRRFLGRDAIVRFFATVPLEGRLDLIPLVPVRANGQPALAAYLREPTGGFSAYGVMVFALSGESITSITGFAGRPELFTQLGLDTRLA